MIMRREEQDYGEPWNPETGELLAGRGDPQWKVEAVNREGKPAKTTMTQRNGLFGLAACASAPIADCEVWGSQH